MDEPLFGERKQGTQISQIVISIIVAGFSLFSVAIGVYFGIKINPRHFVLVATILLIFVSLGLLVRWWRDQDDRIHPKFKYLIFLLAACTIFASISLNCYVWVPKPITCDGVYAFANSTCIAFPTGGISTCTCGTSIDMLSSPMSMSCNACPPPPDNSTSSASGKKLDVGEFDEEYDIYNYDEQDN